MFLTESLQRAWKHVPSCGCVLAASLMSHVFSLTFAEALYCLTLVFSVTEELVSLVLLCQPSVMKALGVFQKSFSTAICSLPYLLPSELLRMKEGWSFYLALLQVPDAQNLNFWQVSSSYLLFQASQTFWCTRNV